MPFPEPSGLKPKINGAKGVYLQPIKYGRSESGNYEVYEFRGTRDEMFSLAQQYAALPNIPYEVTQLPGDLWRIDVRFPYNADGLVDPSTDIIINWTLQSATAEKDLIDSGKGLAGVLTDSQKQCIRDSVQNQKDADGNYFTQATFIAQLTNATDPDGDDASRLAAWEIYRKYISGFRSVPVFQPVLRRTGVTSSEYATANSLANVGRILSTGTLMLSENVPGKLLFDLPNDSNDTPAIPGHTELKYGWLKGYPEVNIAAWNKWSITQDWMYGLWDTDIYNVLL